MHMSYLILLLISCPVPLLINESLLILNNPFTISMFIKYNRFLQKTTNGVKQGTQDP